VVGHARGNYVAGHRLPCRSGLAIFLEPAGIRLYLRAAELYRGLREKGKTVRSTIDCVIAAIAEDGGCALLARDRDMDAILDSGLLKAAPWRPPSSRR
jgi:hypothetical protein